MGGDNINSLSLFDHVGDVTDADSFEVHLTKMLDGIRQQTNKLQHVLNCSIECLKVDNVLKSGT